VLSAFVFEAVLDEEVGEVINGFRYALELDPSHFDW
jgi:hypothetical protein